MVQGSYPGKTRFSGPVQTGRMAHPVLAQWVPGLFPGVKRLMQGFDCPPHSSTVIEGLRMDIAVLLPPLLCLLGVLWDSLFPL